MSERFRIKERAETSDSVKQEINFDRFPRTHKEQQALFNQYQFNEQLPTGRRAVDNYNSTPRYIPANGKFQAGENSVTQRPYSQRQELEIPPYNYGQSFGQPAQGRRAQGQILQGDGSDHTLDIQKMCSEIARSGRMSPDLYPLCRNLYQSPDDGATKVEALIANMNKTLSAMSCAYHFSIEQRGVSYENKRMLFIRFHGPHESAIYLR